MIVNDPPQNVQDSQPAPSINAVTRGDALRVAELILVLMVVIVVLGRLLTKQLTGRRLTYDDWLIIPATIFCIGLTITTSLGNSHYGWGKHVWDVPVNAQENGLRLSWLSKLFFTWSVSTTKISLCFFHLGVLGADISQRIKWSLYSLIGMNVLWGVAFTLATILQCLPVQAYWAYSYSRGHCANVRGHVIANGTTDFLVTGMLYLLSLYLLQGLPLPRWTKLSTMACFAIGTVVCIATVFRIPTTLQAFKNYDFTWVIFDSYIWTIVECDLAIIAVSLPGLAPLVARVVPSYGRRSSADADALRSTPKSALRLLPMHQYPRGIVSSNAYPDRALSPSGHGHGGGAKWWGTRKSHDQARDSQENIIHDVESQDEENAGIVKSTVVEQSYSACNLATCSKAAIAAAGVGAVCPYSKK